MNRTVLDRLDRDIKECGDELERMLQEIAGLDPLGDVILGRLVRKYAEVKTSQEVLRNLRAELIVLEIDKENGLDEGSRKRQWFLLWNRKE